MPENFNYLIIFWHYTAPSPTPTPTSAMNSVAEEIRTALPGTEDILVEYIAGYILDDASEEEDVLDIARLILESPARGREAALENLLARLSKVIDAKRSASAVSRGPKLQRLDKVMEMSKTGSLSTTITFSEGVDLESINKSKWVLEILHLTSSNLRSRATKVDVKKLEKQEAKLRV